MPSPWGFVAAAAVGAAVALVFCGCAHVSRHATDTHAIEHFTNRPDGMIARETWSDGHKVFADFVFIDPTSQGFCDKWTNQWGGNSWFMMAPFSMVVDSNLVPFVTATGTAVGNVVGAAVGTAVKTVAPVPKLPLP